MDERRRGVGCGGKVGHQIMIAGGVTRLQRRMADTRYCREGRQRGCLEKGWMVGWKSGRELRAANITYDYISRPIRQVYLLKERGRVRHIKQRRGAAARRFSR